MRFSIQVCCAVITIYLPACARTGPELTEVSGTVTLNGVEIEEGSIQFIPVEGNTGAGAGGIIRNGKYRIHRANGVAVGKNRVELRSSCRTAGKQKLNPNGPQIPLGDARVQVFPPECNESSTLIKDIQPGSNVIDFPIRTDGK